MTTMNEFLRGLAQDRKDKGTNQLERLLLGKDTPTEEPEKPRYAAGRGDGAAGGDHFVTESANDRMNRLMRDLFDAKRGL